MLRDIAVGGRPLARERLIEEIKAFMRRADVEQAILYGSYARGEALNTSDVDLLVISPRFAGTRPHRRLAELHEQWDPDLPFLEVLAYTPEEFERARRGFGVERVADREGAHLRLLEGGARIAIRQADGASRGVKPMMDKTRDWLTEMRTARQMAQLAMDAGLYSQAILNARQAVELALKAAVLELGRAEPPWTHSLGALVAGICEEVPEEIDSAAKELDPYYITTRYPTEVVPSPTHYYNERDAAQVLRTMALVLDWVRTLLPEDEESAAEESGSSSADDAPDAGDKRDAGEEPMGAPREAR